MQNLKRPDKVWRSWRTGTVKRIGKVHRLTDKGNALCLEYYYDRGRFSGERTTERVNCKNCLRIMSRLGLQNTDQHDRMSTHRLL